MPHFFTERDLERWVGGGIITAEQRDAILRDVEHRPPDAGLDLTTLLYYGGGLLVLLAYSVFLGFQWQELNEAGRIVIAGISLVFFAAASQLLLRGKRFTLPGELLQVVAVAIVPLLVFAVLDAAGLWPEDLGYRAPFAQRHEYEADLTWARMSLTGSAMLAALLAFWWSRSPFVLAAALFSFTALSVDVTLQFDRSRLEYEWQTGQSLIIAAIGAATLAAGIAVRGATERDYSLWLYVLGLAGLAIGLGSRALPEDAAAGWGVLWMIVALGVLALSIIVQERLFAVGGLAAVFTYLAKLVFEVFQDATAALGLALLGLMILGAGMLYQRYSARLFSREGRT